ncbi:MAG: hypothetical protein GXP13_06060 [Gammaproteobacteria bacterium]|nr:hypothetical protein [Gammaproteobacteria bacterium]
MAARLPHPCVRRSLFGYAGGFMSGLTAIVHNTHDNELSIVTGIIKRDSNANL